MSGLLGMKPGRNFKIFRTEFPAVFRFNGRLYQEIFDVITCEVLWVEVNEEDATKLLTVKINDAFS